MKIENIPPLVLQVALAKQYNLPISVSLLEEALNKYPKYFPEEVKARALWDSVPNEVKENYLRDIDQVSKEYNELNPEPFKDGGLLAIINDEECLWQKWRDKKTEYCDKLCAKIHKKHFDKYSIKDNGVYWYF